MLGLFQTTEDRQALFLLGPCHWEPVSENVILRISESASEGQMSFILREQAALCSSTTTYLDLR